MDGGAVWITELKEKLIKQYGKKKGLQLASKYTDVFPQNYQIEFNPSNTLADIENMELLSLEHSLRVNLYYPDQEKNNILKFKLFQINRPIPLHDVIPLAENLDLKVLDQHLYKITLNVMNDIWISDFSVDCTNLDKINIDELKDSFQDVFIYAYQFPVTNDGFNRLVIRSKLSCLEIRILRAYTKYLRQIGFRFTQTYIEQILANYPDIVVNLIKLFKIKFDPEYKRSRGNDVLKTESEIKQALESVANLDDDFILRYIFELIHATVRTNYFHSDKNNKPKDTLTFKFDSKDVPGMPLPLPLYEIFIFSTRFEGIHLRSAKVARGGIRWSDRPEDFRTEILGLMKTQKVKNAVIVPSGAKGGFVLKALSLQASREEIQAEVSLCYQTFIRSLLELTDNIINGKVIHPPQTICYDDEDPYFVVAADKGTATFSDLANSISKEYNFWLYDAFASGGSTGYDHKKMGITAKGAWESVKRHFLELLINIENTDITAVGIGDMSGDVFGNGLLYSKHIKLLAAFDHRDIFLDPNPDPEISFDERQRLFDLPFSSWQSYDPKLISSGGGVYSRKLKSINLSPEVKNMLSLEETSLAPNELIRAILKAKVDLLWNGGIGTYVKASTESHTDASDKSNDFTRVNGCELRARVVGEGGNLGFTQLGRIEFALQGGLINTDFIDNSGGVDCSDHEVNLKILLNGMLIKGTLTENTRDELLSTLTNEIAASVLKDNYYQAWGLSYAYATVVQNFSLYHDLIKEYEHSKLLDRTLEFLPDDKKLIERKASAVGLTRPEIAVLLGYAKINIKHEILNSDLPEDPYYNQLFITAFPETIQKKFSNQITEHPLRREIIATELSNRVVNDMGVFYISRLQTETGATVAEIIRAYSVTVHIFEIQHLQNLIDSLGFKLSLDVQYEMLKYLKHLINISSRWFLRGKRLQVSVADNISHFSKHITPLLDIIPNLMGGNTKAYLDSLAQQFVELGLSFQIAQRIAGSRAMYNALTITEVVSQYHTDLLQTAAIYFAVGEQFNLIWFRDQLNVIHSEGYWSSLARITLRDQLDTLQKALTVAIIKSDIKENDTKLLIAQWISENSRLYDRWKSLQDKINESTNIDFSMFFVALVELTNLLLTV